MSIYTTKLSSFMYSKEGLTMIALGRDSMLH